MGFLIHSVNQTMGASEISSRQYARTDVNTLADVVCRVRARGFVHALIKCRDLFLLNSRNPTPR